MSAMADLATWPIRCHSSLDGAFELHRFVFSPTFND